MSQNLIFRLHTYKYKIDYQQFECPYIVLEDKYTGIPKQILDISLYITDIGDNSLSYKNSESYVRTVCELLNYVFIDNRNKYQLSNLSEITKNIIEDFLNTQCNRLNKQGSPISKKTVDLKAYHLVTMIYSLSRYNSKYFKYIKPTDIATIDKIFTDYKSKEVLHINLVYGNPLQNRRETKTCKSLERDMPYKLVEKFILAARAFDPQLEFAIVLGCYAGLREGEICNVRRVGSIYGSGIEIVKNNSLISSMNINLQNVMELRKDGKSQGRIKRLRKVRIPECFIKNVYDAYQRHLKIINNIPCSNTLPMFLNTRKTNGIYECMTISGYRKRIKKLLMKYILPNLQNSSNESEKIFFMNMLTKTWGAHAFRHWFSVALVLEGYDEIMLQNARGDKSIKASEDYLRNKGELMKLYKQSSTRLQDIFRGDKNA